MGIPGSAFAPILIGNNYEATDKMFHVNKILYKNVFWVHWGHHNASYVGAKIKAKNLAYPLKYAIFL